jgi:hypothetical protein
MDARATSLASRLRGDATEREAAFAELLRLEADHTATPTATTIPVAIHVGGLEGRLEDEAELASLFGRFGTVLAATLRVRREVKNGKQVVSWALLSFGSAAEAQAAIDAAADLRAQHVGLVLRAVDEAQVAQSAGAMGDVMRKHAQARAATRHDADAVVEIAVAMAVPLCEVLCRPASEVSVTEWRRAAQVLTAMSSLEPARVGGECTKPKQCNAWSVLTAPDSALGAVWAKQSAALTVEDALTVGLSCAAFGVQWSTCGGVDATMQAAGIDMMEFFGMFLPAHQLGPVATPSDDRNLALCPLLEKLLIAPERLPEFALGGVLLAFLWAFAQRPVVVKQVLERGAIDMLTVALQAASPSEVFATSGYARKPYGGVVCCMKDLIEFGQKDGTDLSTQLLSSGFIDVLASALGAVEALGAENTNGFCAVYGLLLLQELRGEAFPQIAAKMLKVVSSLRYLVEHPVEHVKDFGYSSGICMIMAAGESLRALLVVAFCSRPIRFACVVVCRTACLFGKDEDNPFGFTRTHRIHRHTLRVQMLVRWHTHFATSHGLTGCTLLAYCRARY